MRDLTIGSNSLGSTQSTPQGRWRRRMHESEVRISLRQHSKLTRRPTGAVTGVYDLGAVVGSLACIGYSDKIGRLRTIFIGLALSIIALVLESSAYSLAQFIVGRVLVGVSIGTISAAVPVWQSECSGARHRGAFVIVEGASISCGITISEWIAWALSPTTNSADWRVPIALPALFTLIALPSLLIMPESPRWLARKGRLDEARRVLARLEDVGEHSPQIDDEIARIQTSLSVIKGSLKDLTRNGKERTLNRTLLAMTGQMFQQMCGISALVFYTGTVFSQMGFTGTSERALACCLPTFQSLCSFLPIFLIDRLGRRKLFMISLSGMAVSMAVVAGTARPHQSSTNGAAIAFFFIYDFFFPLGLLGQTFLYATEVAPLKLRVPITAIANATQWLCQFVVAQVTPPGTTNLGPKYYIIYAVINFVGAWIIYFFFPETMGRSLEEMDHIFEEGSSYFNVVRVARKMPRSVDLPDSDESQVADGKVGQVVQIS